MRLIDADALKVDYYDDYKDSFDGEHYSYAYVSKEQIDNAPTIEPKRGKWIFTNNTLRVCDEWECNQCGNISFEKTNFCDRCGARMKGADDEID